LWKLWPPTTQWESLNCLSIGSSLQTVKVVVCLVFLCVKKGIWKRKRNKNPFTMWTLVYNHQIIGKNKPNNCKLFYSAGTCEHYVSNLSHLFLKKNFAASPYWIERWIQVMKNVANLEYIHTYQHRVWPRWYIQSLYCSHPPDPPV